MVDSIIFAEMQLTKKFFNIMLIEFDNNIFFISIEKQ